jgi:hypothetical protein
MLPRTSHLRANKVRYHIRKKTASMFEIMSLHERSGATVTSPSVGLMQLNDTSTLQKAVELDF